MAFIGSASYLTPDQAQTDIRLQPHPNNVAPDGVFTFCSGYGSSITLASAGEVPGPFLVMSGPTHITTMDEGFLRAGPVVAAPIVNVGLNLSGHMTHVLHYSTINAVNGYPGFYYQKNHKRRRHARFTIPNHNFPPIAFRTLVHGPQYQNYRQRI